MSFPARFRIVRNAIEVYNSQGDVEPIWQEITINVNDESLNGIIMGMQILFGRSKYDFMKIFVNGRELDLDRVSDRTSPYIIAAQVNPSPSLAEYISRLGLPTKPYVAYCKLNDKYIIQFDTLQYLQGMTSIFETLGINPREVIREMLYNGTPVQF